MILSILPDQPYWLATRAQGELVRRWEIAAFSIYMERKKIMKKKKPKLSTVTKKNKKHKHPLPLYCLLVKKSLKDFISELNKELSLW